MSDQQQKMTIEGFVEFGLAFAEADGMEICESSLRRAAEQLAEQGVLAEDEKPEPRRVEVEGAKGLAVGLDDDGDLRLWVGDRDYPLLYQVDVVDDGSRSLKHAPALARALALWCGEEQAPDNPPAEDEAETEPWPYQHIKSDDFDHVKWVATNAHEHDAHLDSDGDVCIGRNTTRRRECVWISRPALAELAAHFCGTPEEQASPEPTQPTPPPEGEVTLRLSKEEAERLRSVAGSGNSALTETFDQLRRADVEPSLYEMMLGDEPLLPGSRGYTLRRR